jgi:hypothetical protein
MAPITIARKVSKGTRRHWGGRRRRARKATAAPRRAETGTRVRDLAILSGFHPIASRSPVGLDASAAARGQSL